MRRLIAAVLAIALFAGFHTAQAAPTIAYPSGWNLVAGPAGSTFPGATAVYGFPPGAEDYIARTSATPSSTGYGYWAYYPQGGSPNLAGNPSNCRTTVTAPVGQYFLAGNTSSTNTATISGASVVYTFDPVANTYVAATTLTPSQGAWVMPDAGGSVTIDAGNCAPAAAAPAVSVPVVAAPVPVAQPAPSTASTNPYGPTPQCPNGFIPTPGNGRGPTMCKDGLCSTSAGPGTCSGHGGVAMRIGHSDVPLAA